MSGVKKLAGKVALITGAGRGIGQGIANRFAAEGASLILIARSEDQLEETANSCKSAGAAAVEVHAADLTDGSIIDDLCKKLLAKHKTVDVLVNNAGTAVQGTPTEGDPDAWDKMLALNLGAPMRFTRHISPGMVEREEGMIINIGSIAAVEPMTSSCAYAATKHGLRGWSLSCYQALRKHNIKVVLINPAFVNTPMVNAQEGVVPERMLQPSDIAEAAMLAVQTTPACCPEEITLRLTRSAYA